MFKTITIAVMMPVAFLAAATGPAAAETRAVAVSYADLDLSSPAGIAAFDRRVAASVKQVCNGGTRDLVEAAATRQCRAQASANAKAQQRTAVAQANGNVVLASK
jgi:UrcA family protein